MEHRAPRAHRPHLDLSFAIAGALVVFARPVPAEASTALAFDVAALTARADVVVRGTVERTTAVWSADHRRIETVVELWVAEVWKGTASKRLAIVEAGGALDGLVQRVEGAATWSRGEEVVAFLQRDPRGPARFRTVGLAQGKLDVLRARGETRVVPSLAGLHLVDPVTRAPVAMRLSVAPLDAFRREVRAVNGRSR